jgi:hypothetical protein
MFGRKGDRPMNTTKTDAEATVEIILLVVWILSVFLVFAKPAPEPSKAQLQATLHAIQTQIAEQDKR